MTRALLLFVAVLGSLAVAAVRADADSVGTLQMNNALHGKFNGIDCAAGNPATTSCYRNVSAFGDLIPGLGKATTTYTLIGDDFGSACTRVHAEIAIVVAGKGEIDLAMPISGCITLEQLTTRFPPIAITVSGGSGRYAGASGGGVLDTVIRETGPGAGFSTITWTGTLNVPGLAFDTTAPQITGATGKVVKTRLAKGARVAYSVKATDATDGTVAAACSPKSGSLFAVGRTTVTCNPTDSSGNPASARFVITVKRVRR